jgi:hypothetical protein
MFASGTFPTIFVCMRMEEQAHYDKDEYEEEPDGGFEPAKSSSSWGESILEPLAKAVSGATRLEWSGSEGNRSEWGGFELDQSE